MTVVTRFAPSPTGFLHIGGARTALFNYLYAKHNDGKFMLRIEDTDRKRSSQDAVDAILGGMKWLGLDWDGDVISQFERKDRHTEIAHDLLAQGKAYKCYCSPEELATMREDSKAAGKPTKYDGRWRDRSNDEAPQGVSPVIRIKSERNGETKIHDKIQGPVTVANTELDDFVILRCDGTPTYMLAVVVDDHDMGITHVVRGDDHLTNTFRQMQIYKAMGWTAPIFAHMPLLHGADGKKLSKRHGALGVEAYRDLGFLPEAVNNYLLRLGWGHGDDEIISRDQAIEWFDIVDVGKGAARFDVDKLTSLNAHYIRESSAQRLTEIVYPMIEKMPNLHLDNNGKARVLRGMDGLKERTKNTIELAESAVFYAISIPLKMNDKAMKILNDDGKLKLKQFYAILNTITDWTGPNVHEAAKTFANDEDFKLGKIAQPLRAALTGTNVSPGVFEVMDVLGKDESLARIQDALNTAA